MNRERITDKEARYMLVLFILGSSIVIGIGTDAKNDAWIAGIIGIMIFIPFAHIYGRIQNLYQGKDLFEIVNLLFGKVFGRIINVIYIWYSLHVGALVLRNFSEFVHVASLTETPLIVILISFNVISIAAARSGIEVIGRISTYALPAVIFILISMEVLSINQMDFNNIKPIFVSGLSNIAGAGFSSFSFPFAESVIFLGVFFTLKKKNSVFKVYAKGLLMSGVILTTLTLVNVFILGPMVEDYYFPSHASFSRIRLGNFIQRMEGTISVSYLITSFVKSSVCLFVTCKGISSLFNLTHYKFIAIQTGLIMAYLAFILYDDTVQMQNWAFNTYQYYAIPFQVIIPLFIWVWAEIKNRMNKKSKKEKVSTKNKRAIQKEKQKGEKNEDGNVG